MRQLRYYGYDTSPYIPSVQDYVLFFGTLLTLGLLFRHFYHRYILKTETTEIRIYTPRHAPQNFQIRIDISNIPPIDVSVSAAAAAAAASSDLPETKKTV
jgi:hypothetical protein